MGKRVDNETMLCAALKLVNQAALARALGVSRQAIELRHYHLQAGRYRKREPKLASAVCAYCLTQFQRDVCQLRRSQRLGKLVFCSNKCSIRYYPPGKNNGSPTLQL